MVIIRLTSKCSENKCRITIVHRQGLITDLERVQMIATMLVIAAKHFP